jgi:hypothetical protein
MTTPRKPLPTLQELISDAKPTQSVTLEQVVTAIRAPITEVRNELSQLIGKMTPKTSDIATDLVAILAAIQGTPTTVSIKSPGKESSFSSVSVSVFGGWIVDITYAKTLAVAGGGGGGTTWRPITGGGRVGNL